MKLTTNDVAPICVRHGVKLCYVPDFLALANWGKFIRPCFARLFRHCLHFQRVCDEILELISRPFLTEPMEVNCDPCFRLSR